MTEAGSDADLLMGDVVQLEEVLSRDEVTKVCKSFFSIFGLPVRVIASGGELLADVHQDRPLCRYLNTFAPGERACDATVGEVRNVDPGSGSVVHTCFTGAVYHLTSLMYQGRAIGRFAIGPYVPAELESAPPSLVAVDPAIDPDVALDHFRAMPRVNRDVAERLAGHLRDVLELLVFSGHRTRLASSMQVASVRENYRELAEKNERLKASVEELKELDKLKSSFLATVSHELRTPLTSIIGYTEMLESGAAGALSDGQSEFLGTIRDKADQLLGLIGRLLDLGRLEADTMKLHKEAVDPRALLSDVGTTIVPAANRNNIRLDIDIADGTRKLHGDPVRLRQILLNLTENAVKFTPDGGRIELLAEPGSLDLGVGGGFGESLFSSSKPAVVLTVRDSGQGIPDDQVGRIFDAFYQIDGSTTREHGGAGLGLSIAKQLVDAHDGKIQVTSAVGEGTVFVITLPAADDHE
ncbi:MAG: ATP-binding protein [Myxococcota bacterium]